jgi:DNA-binding NarL/FixJ family response regulator
MILTEEVAVAAIRTVTLTMSPLLRDLIMGLMAGRRDLDVVEELDTRAGLEERLRALAPDLILIGLDKNEAEEIGVTLVRLLPNAKVIALSNDGRHAFVYRMHPQRTELLDVSAQMLVDTILRL